MPGVLFNIGGKEKKDGKNGNETEYTAGMSYIYENLVGNHAMVQSPFGDKRMTYADYTASGRSLYMIENYISKYVLSYYGNTHTSTSFASKQTTRLREDAKNIIRRCVNASSDDAVIFVGSGATGAIHKLLGVLGVNEPSVGRSTVVFLGPYEHHSNILPWKETGAKLVRINEDRKGQLDMEHLEEELKKHASGQWRTMVGTFSACSNVTGLLVDTIKVTQLMHLYGGIAFWDYAAGAPYLQIDMNPRTNSGTEGSAFKDAFFCSPHKFVGGPGSPGLLVAKKKLFTNTIPHATGGGTVLYVSKKRHSYIKDVEEREEGGTPAIIGSIRAGLVFHLKASLGIDNIQRREMYLARKGINQLHGNPNIILLGSKISPRVPILSFAIRHPASKKLVHHNFISLLLSDLFGIQARGGCACAGPYAQDLLGIAEEAAEGIMAMLDLDWRKETLVSTNSGTMHNLDERINIANSMGIMKPGFTRINLAYFVPDDEVEFILSAVNIVANEGWKLLPQYSYNIERGSWHHRGKKANNLMSLHDITYNYGDEFHMVVKGNINPRSDPGKRQTFADIMKRARRTLETADETGRELYPFDEVTMDEYLPPDLLSFVWWLEPQHAMLSINSRTTKSLAQMKSPSIPLKPRIESGPVQNRLSSRYPKFQMTENFEAKLEHASNKTSSLEVPVKKASKSNSGDNIVGYQDDTSQKQPKTQLAKDLNTKRRESNKRPEDAHKKSSQAKQRRASAADPVTESKKGNKPKHGSRHNLEQDKSKTKRSSK